MATHIRYALESSLTDTIDNPNNDIIITCTEAGNIYCNNNENKYMKIGIVGNITHDGIFDILFEGSTTTVPIESFTDYTQFIITVRCIADTGEVYSKTVNMLSAYAGSQHAYEYFINADTYRQFVLSLNTSNNAIIIINTLIDSNNMNNFNITRIIGVKL